MQKREGFKRVTIEEMRQRKQESERLEHLMGYIDGEINKALVDVVHELGYGVNLTEDGVPAEELNRLEKEMVANGEFINVDTRQEGEQYIVSIRVVQIARELKFDLGGDTQ